MLALGDTQYHVGALSDFEAVLRPDAGVASSRSSARSSGNHEYGTSDARGYFDYFNGRGQQNGPAGPRDKGYYSFDLGSWHLIALNSSCDQLDTGRGRQRVCAGLAAGALAANRPRGPAHVTARSPTGTSRASTPVTAATHRTGQAFWDALYEAGADLVLSGDAHDYERFAPQDPRGNLDPARGIRQFVVGTGGVFFTGWSTLKPNSEVRQNDTFGVLF